MERRGGQYSSRNDFQFNNLTSSVSMITKSNNELDYNSRILCRHNDEGKLIYMLITEGKFYYHILNDKDFSSHEDILEQIMNIFIENKPCDDNIANLLSYFEGCWSFMFLDVNNSLLYYGRDPRGRKNLSIGQGIGLLQNNIILTSIHVHRYDNIKFEPFKWKEVDIEGIYCFDFKDCKLNLLKWPSHVISIMNREEHLIIDQGISLMNENILVDKFKDVLYQSVSVRCSDLQNESHISVLFSGGLDSTVLVALLDQCVHKSITIDLINISFGSNDEEWENTPDRIGGKKSLEDLKKISPERKYQFVKVNVTKEELYEHSNSISLLMHPSKTVMDISISAPLWFGSRGKGLIEDPNNPNEYIEYESKSKVIFVGSGSDEQLGGYGRHRVEYKKGGLIALQKSISLDTNRLWKRNLGRDDRVVGDHNKTTRIPFLDYRVMKWISSQHLCNICDMTLEPGDGDKRILRLLARQLGLFSASKQPKRAIQFGTKIVKQMPKGKGTDLFVQT